MQIKTHFLMYDRYVHKNNTARIDTKRKLMPTNYLSSDITATTDQTVQT